MRTHTFSAALAAASRGALSWRTNNILKVNTEFKNSRLSCFTSDILRMMNLVQNEGIYSDFDVMFLPSELKSIDIDIITGAHLSGAVDVHILKIDNENYKKMVVNKYEELCKESCGSNSSDFSTSELYNELIKISKPSNTTSPDDIPCPPAMAAFTFSNFGNLLYGMTNYPDFNSLVVQGKDDSYTPEGEAKLATNQDPLLEKFKSKCPPTNKQRLC